MSSEKETHDENCTDPHGPQRREDLKAMSGGGGRVCRRILYSRYRVHGQDVGECDGVLRDTAGVSDGVYVEELWTLPHTEFRGRPRL